MHQRHSFVSKVPWDIWQWIGELHSTQTLQSRVRARTWHSEPWWASREQTDKGKTCSSRTGRGPVAQAWYRTSSPSPSDLASSTPSWCFKWLYCCSRNCWESWKKWQRLEVARLTHPSARSLLWGASAFLGRIFRDSLHLKELIVLSSTSSHRGLVLCFSFSPLYTTICMGLGDGETGKSEKQNSNLQL